MILPIIVPQQTIASWTAGTAQCGGIAQLPAHFVAPLASPGWGNPDERRGVTMSFRIDDTGRPLGIERSGPVYAADVADLAPSLAASRFAPGAAHARCTLTYTLSRTAVATASPALVMGSLIAPPGGAYRERLLPAGSSCDRPPPAPLLRTFPDFKALPPAPGIVRWSWIGYDIDRDGRPIAVRVAGGTGDAALDRAAVRAVAQSRYERGARQGCRYRYWQNATPLPAPPAPDVATWRAAPATCAPDLPWARRPVLTYPDAYRRRGIEGWAIVAFDVAPWGETGNVRILAAEPSSEFGTAALQVIRGATKPAAASGYSGCVEKVMFHMSNAPHDPAGTP